IPIVPIDEGSSPAEIQCEVCAVAVHAIGRTEIEKDTLLDTQSGHDEEDQSVFLELGKTAKARLTEFGRTTSLELGAIMMPELELPDFGCRRCARVNRESR